MDCDMAGGFLCLDCSNKINKIKSTAVSLQQPLGAVAMEKAEVRLIMFSSDVTKDGCWNAALSKHIIYSCGSILMTSNEDPPMVQKSNHQSSHRLDNEGLEGGISVKAARADVTGLVREVVLLKQSDGAISASHTSWDRRAPQLTLGAIILQHSWHRIWMVFDPWHASRNAAVAQRRGHGRLLIRLLTSGSFRCTSSTVRWPPTSGKTGKTSIMCWFTCKLMKPQKR